MSPGPSFAAIRFPETVAPRESLKLMPLALALIVLSPMCVWCNQKLAATPIRL